MAIEIAPKPKIKAPPWLIILFVFCMILLLGFLGSYFYFEKSSKELSQSIQEKKDALKMTPSEKALEKEVVLQKEKINAFAELLSKHQKTLNVFDFLQKTTHPKIWFSEFTFESRENRVNVSGQAESFIVLEQQLLILKQEEILKDIILSEILMGEEKGINFSLLLTFNPQIFK